VLSSWGGGPHAGSFAPIGEIATADETSLLFCYVPMSTTVRPGGGIGSVSTVATPVPPLMPESPHPRSMGPIGTGAGGGSAGPATSARTPSATVSAAADLTATAAFPVFTR
jgi:hypothetical protein